MRTAKRTKMVKEINQEGMIEYFLRLVPNIKLPVLVNNYGTIVQNRNNKYTRCYFEYMQFLNKNLYKQKVLPQKYNCGNLTHPLKNGKQTIYFRHKLDRYNYNQKYFIIHDEPLSDKQIRELLLKSGFSDVDTLKAQIL